MSVWDYGRVSHSRERGKGEGGGEGTQRTESTLLGLLLPRLLIKESAGFPKRASDCFLPRRHFSPPCFSVCRPWNFCQGPMADSLYIHTYMKTARSCRNG